MPRNDDEFLYIFLMLSFWLVGGFFALRSCERRETAIDDCRAQGGVPVQEAVDWYTPYPKEHVRCVMEGR